MMRRIKGMQLWYHSKVSNWWVAAIHVLGFSSHSDFAWIISKYCVAGANFIQKSPLWLCDNTLTQLVAILFGIHPYDTVYHNKKTTILAMVCVVCRRQSNVHFCFSPCKCCFFFFLWQSQYCGHLSFPNYLSGMISPWSPWLGFYLTSKFHLTDYWLFTPYLLFKSTYFYIVIFLS